MMMLLAFPQPGRRPAPAAVASAAEAAWSWSIGASVIPRRPEPPTRRRARRVIPRLWSHRSFPAWPGTIIIARLLDGGLWKVIRSERFPGLDDPTISD